MNRVKNLPVGDIWIHCSRAVGRCSCLMEFCSFRGSDVLPFAISERSEILCNFEM